MNSVKKIELREHEPYIISSISDSEDRDVFLESKNLNGNPENLLGVVKQNDDVVCAGYYIGLCHLKENKSALVVLPKINIDYVRMFSEALQNITAINYFQEFYHIDFKSPEIKIDSYDDIITPLIILQYNAIIKEILTRGLRKEYIYRTENLNSKIKGRINFSLNFNKNTVAKRDDRIYCNFLEFCEDNPTNRLLKKALIVAKKYLSLFKDSFCVQIKEFNASLQSFANISDRIDLSEVKNVKLNRLYRNYFIAIRLAKMIIKRLGLSVDSVAEKTHSIPPFWIDMPRLYEVYVLNLLEKKYKNEIMFQVPGYYGTAVDYVNVDKKLIIDAKYKPRYGTSNARIIDDIREISGYAGDRKIRQVVKAADGEQLKCVIIYPRNNLPDSNGLLIDADNNDSDNDDSFSGNLTEFKIKQFDDFYKTSIDLPIKHN